MKLKERLKRIIVSLYLSIRRFPVTLFLSACGAVMITIISEMSPSITANLSSILTRITMALFLGVPLSLCIRLFYEKCQGTKLYKLYVYYAAGAAILVLYYLFLLKDTGMVPYTRYAAVFIALTAGFFFIPNLGQKQHFELYTINVFKSFLITAIYSLVLFSGLSAILITLNKLLSVNISSKAYFYTFIYIVCIFALSYFLAVIPGDCSMEEKENYPKAFRILILYIVMPLITAYTLILYIYFIKIIITGQWPVGMVANLVLWYSIVCTAVMFFITPISGQNIWTRGFFTWFPRVIVPLMAMMFVSIGIRINAYGFTESRYYVVLMGAWASGMMIYYWFYKGARNIILPVTIAIIALISVFGPLSSYSISTRSQNGRFEGILTKNKMLSGGTISAAPADISQADRKDITSILYYFMDKHSLKDVKYLPDNFKIEDMQKVLGFPPESAIYQPGEYVNIAADRSGNAIDISGYQYLIDVPGLYGKTGASGDISVVYNSDNQDIIIKYKGVSVYEKGLDAFVKGLTDKYAGSQKANAIPIEEMTFTDENNRADVKFIFLNISASRDSSAGETKVNGLDFYVLVRIK